MIAINFFGTHDFAAGILQALVDSDLFEIGTVFTAPDRPVGRHQEIQKSAVKILAEKHHLRIEQPASLMNYELGIKNYELNVVCDYGLIVPKEILNAPKFSSLNVHPSLLPKYRGASPIQSAILNGEAETGVTIIMMDEKLDHGPILAQKTVKIEPTDDYNTLSAKLLETAKTLLIDAAQKWVDGQITPQAQDDALATNCREFTRDDGRVDFGIMTAAEIYNRWRALTPWPGVWCKIKDKRLKILRVDRQIRQSKQIRQIKSGEAVIENNQIMFVCADGNFITILDLQLEGKKAMTASEFINGYKHLLE